MINKILKSCDNEFNTREELIELAKKSSYALMKKLVNIQDNIIIKQNKK